MVVLLAYKFFSPSHLLFTHTQTHSHSQGEEEHTRRGKDNTERRAMEHSYSSNSGISNYGSTKERRPALKRGQLKRQIVRTISNLMSPRNDGAGAGKGASGRTSFGAYN
ncbi:hypothetical protein CFC21_007718 [Triticum aestivum]|uniref:Uncharacterized protein n=2 Tax=Triticum aestivum TaxID=4565 RepID=A0A9R1DEL8_WHEAT|nr:hypothetical protein CFC21_007718 [Triticum aestivum]